MTGRARKLLHAIEEMRRGDLVDLTPPPQGASEPKPKPRSEGADDNANRDFFHGSRIAQTSRRATGL